MGNEFLSWVLNDTPALKEISLDEVGSRIREAIYKKHDPSAYISAPLAASSSSFYVVDIYPGYAILSKDGGFFKVTFEVTPEGIVVGDEMVRVEKAWVEVQ